MNGRTVGLCLLCVLSAAAILGCSATTPGDVFPAPYVVGAGPAQIVFTDLCATCTIEIFTLSGELVRTLEETDGDGQLTWDMKNEAGNDLTAGMYLYTIVSTSEVWEGKLIISK